MKKIVILDKEGKILIKIWQDKNGIQVEKDITLADIQVFAYMDNSEKIKVEI